MNYQALDAIVPVDIYDETILTNPNAKPIKSYKSISKAALYSGIKVERVSKLVNANHSKPIFSAYFNTNIFFRKHIK